LIFSGRSVRSRPGKRLAPRIFFFFGAGLPKMILKAELHKPTFKQMDRVVFNYILY